jgi:hypothetical protein
MKIFRGTTNFAIVLTTLLAGCAFVSKTEIQVLHSKFMAERTQKKLELIKFDFHTIEPMGTDKAIALQFGLIGALAWVATQSAKNNKDNTVDTVGIILHQKALSLLKDRLSKSSLVRYANIPSDTTIDPVALSKNIRHNRLFGSTVPTRSEIAAFNDKHGLDYFLYNANWGGIYKSENKFFISSKWEIYDSTGNEKVSMFTMSVDDKTSPDSLSTEATIDKLLQLFSQNIDRFLNAITKIGP